MPHTKGEFAEMVNTDRANGYTHWDHLPFAAWWEKICGRAFFPTNPKTGLQAALDRVIAIKGGAECQPTEDQVREKNDAYYQALRLAEAWRPTA